MNITLFDAAQQVREALNQIDPDTGELLDFDNQSRALFEQKAIGCVAYAKEEAGTIAAAKAMLKEMADKIASREKRLERFEAYMADCMKATGITEVKHETGLWGAKLYLDRDESVELEEGATFPPELCNDPKPPSPSKTKIRMAILSGQPVVGAKIVRKDRLVIK